MNNPNKYYINLSENRGFNFSSEPIDLIKTFTATTTDIINVNFFEKSHGVKIEDTLLLGPIVNVLKKIAYSGNYTLDKNVEAFYMGDIQIKKSVNTKLVFVKIKEDDEYRHEIVLGLNIFNNQVVSVIKLSETVETMGFGDLIYSRYYDEGVFKIIFAWPSDIAGKTDNVQAKSKKIRMRNNGKLH